MKLASAIRGASTLSSLAVLLSIGCGGDFRTASSTDGGSSTGGKSSGGKSGGGALNGGNSGSTGDDSGAGGDGAGGAPGGGGSGGTAGKGAGGGANGGRAGHGNGGAQAGGGSGAGNGGTGGSGGVVGNGGAATGGAGGRNTAQHASDYDQQCNYDSQCSLVNDTSDACGCKTCLNAAISSGDIAKWNADRKAFNCPIPICQALPCPDMLAACANGTCVARKPFVVGPQNYDTACTSNVQCTTIPVGEICDPCQCAVGAVSYTGLQQYKADKAKVACTPGGLVACSCAPPVGSPVCSSLVGMTGGVCTMGTD